MLYKDINKRFTEVVAEYLAKGYTINTATMSGSQGEISKVDLTDGTEIIRVLLDNFNDFGKGEGLRVEAGKVKNSSVVPNVARGMGLNTIWNDHLEVISSEDYYQVGSRSGNGNVYYGTEEEAREASKKQMARRKARDMDEVRELPEAAKEIALAYVRRQPKCGRKKISDIDSVYSINGKYMISIGRVGYALH